MRKCEYMNTQEMISQLKTIVNNDTAYCERAERLQWLDISEERLESNLPFKNIYAEILHFPKGYVDEHFLDVYVRCVLSHMAHLEEWDKDFWKEENLQKEDFNRKGLLESAKSREFYTDYNTVDKICLNAVTEEELVQEFLLFTKTFVRKSEFDKPLTAEEIEFFKESVKGSAAVLIGYNSYGSSVHIAVRDDTVIFLDCSNYD